MNAMEKLNFGVPKIPEKMSKDIKKMFDKLHEEGFQFEIEETPDTFVIHLFDSKGKKHGLGFMKGTNSSLKKDMENSIRYPKFIELDQDNLA